MPGRGQFVLGDELISVSCFVMLNLSPTRVLPKVRAKAVWGLGRGEWDSRRRNSLGLPEDVWAINRALITLVSFKTRTSPGFR